MLLRGDVLQELAPRSSPGIRPIEMTSVFGKNFRLLKIVPAVTTHGWPAPYWFGDYGVLRRLDPGFRNSAAKR